MKLLGGAASSENSIIFYSEHYTATAFLESKTQTINISFSEHKLNNDKLYLKIPILRRLILDFYQRYIHDNKLSVDVYTVASIIIYTLDKIFLNINPLKYLYGVYYLLFFIFIKSSDVSKIHGAEHAVYNHYNKDKKLNNIESIKKEKLEVDRCGTTSYITNLILFYVSCIFLDDFMIQYLITKGFSTEIVVLIESNKVANKIGKPIIKLSRFLQRTMLTKRPDDIHVKMAIMAVKKLEELELNYKK
jgi:uncharacterized protein YqhQ